MNDPGLPMLSNEVLQGAVDEAHKHDKMVFAHVLTAETSKTAIDLGVDGLTNIFIVRPD